MGFGQAAKLLIELRTEKLIFESSLDRRARRVFGRPDEGEVNNILSLR